MRAVGERVVAIRSATGTTVHVYGRGVYAGDEVPSGEDLSPLARMLRDARVANPKIVLDSGKVVWGCECWWGPESNFEEMYRAGRQLVDADIDQDRAGARGKEC